MSRFQRQSCSRNAVSLLVAALLFGLSDVSVRAVSPEEWTSLSKGQVVVGEAGTSGKIPSVQAKILIPCPPEQVWPVVSDPQRLMKQEQKVKKVKYLAKTPTSQQVEFTVLMTKLFPAFNYVLRQDLMAPQIVKFHRVSGSFKDIQGSWQLTPVENGQKTVLTYTLQLDPGPMIPKNLLMSAVKSDLPTMMRNAKRAIEAP